MRIHYQEKGAGAPLVLLHGYMASTFAWKDVFDPLSQQFRVIAVDLKGFGFSGKPDGDYTRRAQGDLVVQLLDHLKIDRAILCGNSMGGEVSMNAAVRHPDRVSALILVNSGGRHGQWRQFDLAERDRVAGHRPGADVAGADFRFDWCATDCASDFYDNSIVTDEQVAAYYRPLKTRDGQRAAYLAHAQGAINPIEPEINKIEQPTLIIWGAEDELIPLEAGRRLNSLIAGSRLVVFDKCGHVPQAEMPERFADEVRSFVTVAGSTFKPKREQPMKTVILCGGRGTRLGEHGASTSPRL